MAKSLSWYKAEQMVLKITLLGSEPKIWRRVEVHSGLTLHDLHAVIQCVFMWEDSHLYHFMVTPDGKLTNKALREAIYYSVNAPFFEDEEPQPRSDEMLVGRVFTDACRQIVYEYDFGDSWYHQVKLEKRKPGGSQDHIPECLAGENAAPFDDMGGIGGYYYWLEALQDPGNERHAEMVEAFGDKFDPAFFDLALANRRLAATFTPAPKKPPKKRK